MSLEGKINIRLSWDGQSIRGVALQPRALVPATALLCGKTARQAAELVPLLFSICAKAQGAAAVTALAAAQQGETSEESSDEASWHERRVQGEALQELLWRFLLDLPGILGGTGDPALLARLRRRFAAVALMRDEAAWQQFGTELEATLADAILGMPAEAWYNTADLAQLLRGLRSANTETARLLLQLSDGMGRWGGSTVKLMPQTNRERVLEELLPGLESTADFALHPLWQGQVMETGALARMRHVPLLAEILRQEGATIFARLLARLFEMVELVWRLRDTPGQPAQSPWVQGAQLGRGVGGGWVQTARGLLLHRVALGGDGSVADYRIVAPTEWNFHPAGAYVQGLTGRPAASVEEARRQAELLLQALDPCVAYGIEVNHA